MKNLKDDAQKLNLFRYEMSVVTGWFRQLSLWECELTEKPGLNREKRGKRLIVGVSFRSVLEDSL